MNNTVTIYLGNFTDRNVLVEIGSHVYEIEPKDCRYIKRESQKATVMVKIGFKAENPVTLDKKEFNLEMGGVIRFCEYNGELRFCEIEKLEPKPTLKLID